MHNELLLAAYYYPVDMLLKRYLDANRYENLLSVIEQMTSPIDGSEVCNFLKQLNGLEAGEETKRIKSIINQMPVEFQNDTLPRLFSVFSMIELDRPTPARAYFPLSRMSAVDIYPTENSENTAFEVKEHLQKFVDSMVNVWKRSYANAEHLIARLLSVIETYCWCIPAGTNEAMQFVSLSEHCKLLAALTAAAGETNPEQSKMLLLVGDLSGIQKYLFDIAQAGTGGVAKRLRARSFMLGAIADVVSHRILHRFKLPLWNLIMSSGGKFYLLLPGGNDINNQLDLLQSELDQWAINEFNAEIAIHFGTASLRLDSLRKMNVVMEQLNQSLHERKQNSLKKVLRSPTGQWNPERFVIRHDKISSDKCVSCKKFNARDDGLCAKCLSDEEYGRRLTKAKYVIFRHQGEGLSIWDNYTVDVADSLPNEANASEFAYLIYNIYGDEQLETSLPVVNKPIANHIPITDDGHPVTFEEIASYSEGSSKLAYLKADVDHLGSVFIFGLQYAWNQVQIQQISTLSKLLDKFFSGWLNRFVAVEFPNVYTVFSGGDDLFLIGPWNDILKLVGEIERCFRTYVSNNANITLSAGISICRPHSPIYKEAELAEVQLEIAKESISNNRPNGRNQISLFHKAMTWDEFNIFITKSMQLGRRWQENLIPSAFIYRLCEYADLYELYLRGNTDGLRFYPKLAHNIKRNFPVNKTDDAIMKWVQSFLTLEENHPLADIRHQVEIAKLLKDTKDEIAEGSM